MPPSRRSPHPAPPRAPQGGRGRGAPRRQALVAAVACACLLPLLSANPTPADEGEARELQHALERAPPQCRNKLLEYKQRRQAARTAYKMDPVAEKRCNKEVMKVSTGPDPGKIKVLPSSGAKQPHHTAGVRADAAQSGEALAFLILAHKDNDPLFLNRLVKALARPEHTILIHVDAKAPQEIHSFAAALTMTYSTENVHVLTPSIEVSWGGASMLRAELLGLKFLLESHVKWQHLLVISGSDYPVKSAEHMSSKLKSFGQTSHFEIFEQIPDFARARGFEQAFVECEGFVYKVDNQRPKPTGITVWGGSSWVTLSRSFGEFVSSCLFKQSQRDPNNFFRTVEPDGVPEECRIVTDFLDFCEHSLSAEELFFHTVFMNSKHCVDLDNRYLRWVHWLEGREGVHCGTKADWCGKSPGIVGLKEMRTAYNMPAFFARKFSQTDLELLDTLDAMDVEDVEIARLKLAGPAKASSFEVSREKGLRQISAYAADGNDFTRWSSTHASDREWLQVELAEEGAVCGASIAWESARPASFHILTRGAQELEKWSMAYTYNIDDEADEQAVQDNQIRSDPNRQFPPYELRRYRFEPHTAKHVKLDFLQRATHWGYSLWELELHGCSEEQLRRASKARDEL